MNSNSPAGAFRRKLNTSCYMCKKRKVRCDATPDESCSACKRAGIECRTHLNQPRPTSARRRRGSPKNSITPANSNSEDENKDDKSNNSKTLSRFFEAGLLSLNWTNFEENGTFRNVYIGTDVANLHHLVRDHEPPGNHFLCYPFPAIRDELPWKPHPELKGHHYLTAESVHDLSSLPVRSVRDALVATYFEDIHPGFPVIDEAEFRRRYYTDAKNPPPLLLLQAVLLAAARITTHPQVAASRARTTATLYRRAKTLFDLRHESDRVDLIQAALLLAWYTENSDTVSSNAYYWTGNATRIAFGMALHRRASLRYVPVQRARYYRKYKKIWWMLLYSEVMLALEYGRPCMIRAGDFDVGGLEDEDFRNMDDSDDQLVDRGFCSVLADLSLVALDVVTSSSTNIEAIEHRLAQAAVRIRPSHDIWSCQLRLVYNLIVLVVYRSNNSHKNNAAKLRSEAASNILTTFETMLVQNTIRQCHLSSTTALMAAAIQFAREVRSSAAQHILSAISAQAQLERLLKPAEALAGVFVHVEAVWRLCRSLNACAERVIRECQASFSSSVLSPVAAQLPASAEIDWEDIMTNYRMQNGGFGFGFGVGGEEWLSEYPGV